MGAESGEKRSRRTVLTHATVVLGWLVSVIGVVQWATPRSLPVFGPVTVSACALSEEGAGHVFHRLSDIPIGQSKIFFFEELRLSFSGTVKEKFVLFSTYPEETVAFACANGPGYIEFLDTDFNGNGDAIASVVFYEEGMFFDDVRIGGNNFHEYQEEISRTMGCPDEDAHEFAMASSGNCSLESVSLILRLPLKQRPEDRFIDTIEDKTDLVFQGTFIVTQALDESQLVYNIFPADMARTSEYSAYRCTMFQRSLPAAISFLPCVWPLTLMSG